MEKTFRPNPNSFKNTFCVFKEQNLKSIENLKLQFQSKSGSCYYYTTIGMYRLSNHWGRLANSKWRLEPMEPETNSKTKVGFAPWTEFYPDNALEELYTPYLNQFLALHHIEAMEAKIDEVILKHFKEIYKEGEITRGKNLLAFEVAKRNVYNFLQLEKKDIEEGQAIKVLLLEASLSCEIEVKSLSFPIKIKSSTYKKKINTLLFVSLM